MSESKVALLMSEYFDDVNAKGRPYSAACNLGFQLESELALTKQKLADRDVDNRRLAEYAKEIDEARVEAQLHIKELREALELFVGNPNLDGMPFMKAAAVLAKQPDTRAREKALLEAEIKVLSAMQSAKRFGQGTYDRGEISFMITTREAKLAELNKEKE